MSAETSKSRKRLHPTSITNDTSDPKAQRLKTIMSRFGRHEHASTPLTSVDSIRTALPGHTLVSLDLEGLFDSDNPNATVRPSEMGVATLFVKAREQPFKPAKEPLDLAAFKARNDIECKTFLAGRGAKKAALNPIDVGGIEIITPDRYANALSSVLDDAELLTVTKGFILVLWDTGMELSWMAQARPELLARFTYHVDVQDLFRAEYGFRPGLGLAVERIKPRVLKEQFKAHKAVHDALGTLAVLSAWLEGRGFEFNRGGWGRERLVEEVRMEEVEKVDGGVKVVTLTNGHASNTQGRPSTSNTTTKVGTLTNGHTSNTEGRVSASTTTTKVVPQVRQPIPFAEEADPEPRASKRQKTEHATTTTPILPDFTTRKITRLELLHWASENVPLKCTCDHSIIRNMQLPTPPPVETIPEITTRLSIARASKEIIIDMIPAKANVESLRPVFESFGNVVHFEVGARANGQQKCAIAFENVGNALNGMRKMSGQAVVHAGKCWRFVEESEWERLNGLEDVEMEGAVVGEEDWGEQNVVGRVKKKGKKTKTKTEEKEKETKEKKTKEKKLKKGKKAAEQANGVDDMATKKKKKSKKNLTKEPVVTTLKATSPPPPPPPTTIPDSANLTAEQREAIEQEIKAKAREEKKRRRALKRKALAEKKAARALQALDPQMPAVEQPPKPPSQPQPETVETNADGEVTKEKIINGQVWVETYTTLRDGGLRLVECTKKRSM